MPRRIVFVLRSSISESTLAADERIFKDNVTTSEGTSNQLDLYTSYYFVMLKDFVHSPTRDPQEDNKLPSKNKNRGNQS